MTFAVGQTVAGYRLTGRLGAGGMGEVFRAEDPQLGREVALKVIAADVAAHPARLARFRREARLLAALSHAGIAAVYGLEEHDGVPVLVLELIEGPTLQERLRGGPPIAVTDAVRLGAEVAHALAAAHAKGIVHRDLKPANIKLTAAGHVKLLDFGIAKALDPADGDADVADEPTVELTADGAVFGTAPYMSPEQIRGTPVDRAADVWALGCVLFEMLAGRRAFANVAAVLEQEPEWSRLPAETPKEVRDLLRRTLSKNPARRPRDVADLARVLDELALALATGARPRSAGAAARRGVYAGVAAAAGVAIVLGVMSLSRVDVTTAPEDPVRRVAGAPVRSLVAVLPLRNLSGSADAAWIGTALGETISAELRAGDGLHVVPGERIAQMQADLDLPEAESYTTNTLSRIRGLVSADYIVAGGFLANGPRIRVDLRVQDARTGNVAATVSETGAATDLIELTTRVGTRLRPVFGGPASAGAGAAVRTALPSDARAARLYAAALASQRRYDLEGARRLLEEAAALDPQAPLVQLALSRMWSLRGYQARAAAAAQAAHRHATALPWETRTAIEARHYETSNQWPQAAETYRRLLAQHPDDLDFGLLLAAAERAAGRTEAARAALADLRRLPPPAGDDPRIDLEEHAVHLRDSNGVDALAAAERALSRADAVGSRFLLARAHNAAAASRFLLGEYDAARESAREAQRMAEAVGDQLSVALALRNIGVACYYLSDPDCMVRYAEQSMLVARDVGDRRLESQGLSNMSVGEILLGRVEAALRHEQEALAIELDMGNEPGAIRSLHNVGEIQQGLARLADAEHSYREALERARRLGDRLIEGFALTGLGDVLAARDDGAGARASYDEAIRVRTEAGSRPYLAAGQLALATFLVEVGAAAEAERLAASAAAIFEEVRDRDREAWARGFVARAQLEQGRRADAVATIDAARLLAERAAYQRARLTFAMNEARVLAASRRAEDLGRARALLEGVLADAARLGMRNRELEARLALGEIERRAPATAAAGRRRLEQLARDAEALDYRLLARRARAALP